MTGGWYFCEDREQMMTELYFIVTDCVSQQQAIKNTYWKTGFPLLSIYSTTTTLELKLPWRNGYYATVLKTSLFITIASLLCGLKALIIWNLNSGKMVHRVLDFIARVFHSSQRSFSRNSQITVIWK